MRLASVEKPWLKLYEEGAAERALKILPYNTIWDFVKDSMQKSGDAVPAMKYFDHDIKRSELIAKVDMWARTFRGMGVKEDDRVVLFVPFTPESAYFIFALIEIGACPVMLNLASGPEAISAGAEGARLAIIADVLEDRICHVTRNAQKFPQVMVIDVATEMPAPKRQIAGLATWRKRHSLLRSNPNYFTSAHALVKWSSYQGKIKADPSPGRPALITSSGGTSSKGYAKQIIDTNESILAMCMQNLATVKLHGLYKSGYTCYTSLPPFVSTSLFVLFFAPLVQNMCCVIEPRLDGKVFTDNMLKYRPQLTLIPGRCWMYFCEYVKKEMERGCKPDLSFMRVPIMGGEGVIPKELKWMNRIIRECGSPVEFASGYGLSEVFSVLSFDTRMKDTCPDDYDKDVINVGIPFPAVNIKVVDSEDNELPYGEKGELCVQSTTIMKGYYNNDELTKKVICDGWLHTGDLCSIDEDGYIYHYCRMADAIPLENGNRFYPADLEYALNRIPEVRGTLVCNRALAGEEPKLYVHVNLHSGKTCADHDLLNKLDRVASGILPEGLRVEGYKFQKDYFRMSNVCKTDRNSYVKESDGYLTP